MFLCPKVLPSSFKTVAVLHVYCSVWPVTLHYLQSTLSDYYPFKSNKLHHLSVLSCSASFISISVIWTFLIDDRFFSVLIFRLICDTNDFFSRFFFPYGFGVFFAFFHPLCDWEVLRQACSVTSGLCFAFWYIVLLECSLVFSSKKDC